MKRHVDRFLTEHQLRQLTYQYSNYRVEGGGEFYPLPSCIPKGCALSPLLGALFLWELRTRWLQ